MTELSRTWIRRLVVQGYRSIQRVELHDLPNLIVLHGPNGSGKSNLLRAAFLAMRAVANAGTLDTRRGDRSHVDLPKAFRDFGLRPEDFHRGQREIRIELSLEIARHRLPIVGDFDVPPTLDVVLVAQDPDDRGMHIWLETALLGGDLRLQPPFTSERLKKLRQEHSTDPRIEPLELAALQTSDHLRRLLEGDALLARIDANRFPSHEVQGEDSTQPRSPLDGQPVTRSIQRRLFEHYTSEERARREILPALTRALKLCGALSQFGADYALTPVFNKRFQEHQLLVEPSAGDAVPLSNLGTGEEQLLLLLERVLSARERVVQVEEPEAHLHWSLMEKLATYLHAAVEPGPKGERPDVDQLWLETHHQLFAIAPRYLDVSLRGGATCVEWKARAKAEVHFPAPGVLFEVLESLAESGRLNGNPVLFIDDGKPVRSDDLLASIHGDRHLVNRYVKTLTEQVVFSMKERAKGQP